MTSDTLLQCRSRFLRSEIPRKHNASFLGLTTVSLGCSSIMHWATKRDSSAFSSVPSTHSAAQEHRFGFSLQQFQKLSYSTRISTREMLSVGYFENSKMGVSLPPYPARDLCLQSKYHDDGERPWAQPLRRSPLVAVRSCRATKGDWRPRAQVWFLSSGVPKTLLFHKNFDRRNGHVIISLVEILVEQESFWNF
jgi:hypothetical protein